MVNERLMCRIWKDRGFRVLVLAVGGDLRVDGEEVREWIYSFGVAKWVRLDGDGALESSHSALETTEVPGGAEFCCRCWKCAALRLERIRWFSRVRRHTSCL